MKTIAALDLLAGRANAGRAAWFRCRDTYSLSDKRRCLRLAAGESAQLEFNVGVVPAGTAEVCLTGALEAYDSHAYVHKFINSVVEISVNETVVHGGLIHWRSHEETASYWPTFDFPFDCSLLKRGRNVVSVTNKTSRAALGEFFDAKWLEAFDAATAERKISTHYISGVEVNLVRPPRTYPRLSGVPLVAVAGRPFVVEVSTGSTRLEVGIGRADNADVCALGTELEFGEYRSLFEVTPQRAGRPCGVLLETEGKQLEAAIGTVYSDRGYGELIAGPGVETTYWHQLLRGAEDFFALDSGNCLRVSIDDFLNNLHHIPTAEWFPLIRYLVRRRRYYALQRIRVPPYSRIQHADLAKLADIGGNLFAGVSIAEPVLFFHHDPAGRQPDLAKRIEAYRAAFRKRLEEVRLPGHRVVTFDSSGGMCGHYYELGLDAQISEIGPACNVLEEACSRGAASVFGKPWGVATAMHWYCGQGAQYAYDDSRVRYAWLTMLHSYLAGARQIVWEGGVFDNIPVYNFILSEESWRDFGRRYDHPALVKVRDGFRRLLDFHRAQQLPGPTVRWGVVRGINGMPISFADAASRYGDMSMARAWTLLKVFLPHVCLGKLDTGRNIRRWYSATPYGQVDVVPGEASEKDFSRYRLLAFLGWNTMTDDLYQRLLTYVRKGGVLFISAAHFTTDTIQKLEWSFINDGDLSELCGVRVKDLGGRIETATFRTNEFQRHLAKTVVLSEKNPLFVSHFDESYPVFERDVTYFGGDLEVEDARVLAVSQRGEPVLLRRKLGRGQVYLFNSYAHPGRGNLLTLAEGILRTLVESLPGDVRVDDPCGVVSWFEYPCDGFTRYFFLNTDWTKQDATAHVAVSVGGKKHRLRLQPGVPVQIASDGNMNIVVPDPATQIAAWRKKGGKWTITLVGGDASGVRCSNPGAVTISRTGSEE